MSEGFVINNCSFFLFVLLDSALGIGVPRKPRAARGSTQPTSQIGRQGQRNGRRARRSTRDDYTRSASGEGSSGAGSGIEDDQRSTDKRHHFSDEQPILSPASSTGSCRRFPKKRDFYGLHERSLSSTSLSQSPQQLQPQPPPQPQPQQQPQAQPEQHSPGYGPFSSGSHSSSHSSSMAHEFGATLRLENTLPMCGSGPPGAATVAQTMPPFLPVTKREPDLSCALASLEGRPIEDTVLACEESILQRVDDPRAFQQASHRNVSHILTIERSVDTKFEFRVMSEACCGNYVSLMPIFYE